MTAQKRIALIVPGGFGTGKNNMGIPVLEQIVNRLSIQFGVVVFQLFKVNEGYIPNGYSLHGFNSGNKIVQYFRLAIAFYREDRGNKFAAVHGYWVWPCGFLAAVFGMVFKIKSIVSVLGGDAVSLPELNYGHLRKYVSRKLILWSLQQCDEATALTNYLAKNLQHVGLKRILKIIPWGVDHQLFFFQPKAIQEPVQFLHVANLSPVKDQGTLLRAFEIICRTFPSHLTIIGEGTEELNVRALINQLQLENTITLSGQLKYEEVAKLYHQSDVLLHTSRSEGQSEVITEAISCGTLVAGTNVGLIHDFPEFCISVDVGDYESLANRVIALLKDPAKMTDFRQRGHHWAVEHSIEWTVSRIIELY